MGIKVAKFGGSSLADAGQFKKVRDIILSDPDRRYVVPSAPGKRTSDDIKVTDLLYQCYRLAHTGRDYSECFSQIVDRLCGIVSELGLRSPVRVILTTPPAAASFSAASSCLSTLAGRSSTRRT